MTQPTEIYKILLTEEELNALLGILSFLTNTSEGELQQDAYKLLNTIDYISFLTPPQLALYEQYLIEDKGASHEFN